MWLLQMSYENELEMDSMLYFPLSRKYVELICLGQVRQGF